jgi:hypothetical protein
MPTDSCTQISGSNSLTEHFLLSNRAGLRILQTQPGGYTAIAVDLEMRNSRVLHLVSQIETNV